MVRLQFLVLVKPYGLVDDHRCFDRTHFHLIPLFLWNVGNCLTILWVSHPRRLHSSNLLLWEPQIICRHAFVFTMSQYRDWEQLAYDMTAQYTIAVSWSCRKLFSVLNLDMSSLGTLFYLCGVHPVALFTYTIWTYKIYNIYICNPQSQLFLFARYLTTCFGPYGPSSGEKNVLKLHGLSPRVNYTDQVTAACRRSDCQLARIEGATWSAWWIPMDVFSVF
jgi:hypothetical protein